MSDFSTGVKAGTGPPTAVRPRIIQSYRPGMIRVAQLYTGGVGSEIVRRLAGHPQLELVGVLVHSAEKTGRDSGELVGVAPNGITTTQDVDEIIALGPDAAIHSGMLWDHELIGRLLEAGINVYTGMGGYYLPGQPEYDALQAAGLKGNASFAAGGNIPGLISDVFPLFLSGYTGRIRHIRAWQRNHVETYPSAAQLEQGLGIGLPPGSNDAEEMVDGGWVWAAARVAPHAVTLPTSGLHIAEGHVAALQWTFSGFAGDHEFLTITNEQSAMLGLGPGWRENHEEPPWRVEIDGEPPIVATFGRTSANMHQRDRTQPESTRRCRTCPDHTRG